MAERERSYWWHVGRYAIIEKYMEFALSSNRSTDLKILNIGAGTGGTIHVLEQFGKLTNADTSNESVKYLKKRNYGVDKISTKKLPYDDSSFDATVALDVLEHIQEDTEALKEWRRVLKPGGRAIVSVPAYQWLWSDHDVSLGHFRRYTKKEILKKAAIASLDPIKSSYAIVFSLPLIVVFRLLNGVCKKGETSTSSYVDVPGWINSFFIKMLILESRGHKLFHYPFGTSVFSILEKPNPLKTRTGQVDQKLF